MEVPDHVAVQFFKSYVEGVDMSGVYAARCIVCGDSEKHRQRKRLYMIKKESSWMVYCHNCGYSSSLLRFAKDFFPSNYQEITNQCFKDFFFSFEKKKEDDKTKKAEDALSSLMSGVEKKPEKAIKIADQPPLPAQEYITKNCFPLTDDCADSSLQRTIDELRERLRARRISQSLIDKMYYAFDGDFRQRVIIPFFDEHERIYYFQAMATMEFQMKYKYLNFKHDSIVSKPQYNECHVDKTRDVYIVEGLFDSTFVENSIATMGANLSKEGIRAYKRKYRKRVWVLDNDEAGLRTTNRLFDMGEKCFLIPKEYKNLKDLNDIAVLSKKDDLTKIVKDNSYNNITGLVELSGR